MNSTVMDRRPSMAAVAVEQLRTVGLSVRWEGVAICVGLFLILAIVPFADPIIEEVGSVLNPADLGVLALMLGLITPLAVWRGEKPFGDSQLWTYPVDHTRHARLKVAAGWVWLMSVVTLGVSTLALTFQLAGGDLGYEGVRWLVLDRQAAATGAAGGLQQVPWSTPWWQWLHPFVVGTWGYLAVTTVLLGFQRPLHWVAGGWIVMLGFGMLAEGEVRWALAVADAIQGAIDWLASAGQDYRRMTAYLESGERVRGWMTMPSFDTWVRAMSAWMFLAVAGTWLATGRHREG